eukprot:2797980-Alexandrium_andersonii.AAC.1
MCIRDRGYPLAWRKTTAGPSVVWVGACLEILSDSVHVAIPDKKVSEVLVALADFERSGFRRVKRARSCVSELSVVACLVPMLRPHVRPL